MGPIGDGREHARGQSPRRTGSGRGRVKATKPAVPATRTVCLPVLDYGLGWARVLINMGSDADSDADSDTDSGMGIDNTDL